MIDAELFRQVNLRERETYSDNHGMFAVKRSNPEIARLFDQAAERFDEVSNSYTVSRRMSALVRLVYGRCLEFGGGTGEFSARVNGNQEPVHSDISPRMCAVAKRKCGCPSICFDAERVPLAADSIDTAVGSEMVYYLEHPERFIAEAYRILRPGGRLLICTTNPAATLVERGRSLLRKLGFKKMFFDDGSPKFISMSRLTEMLLEGGFTIERTDRLVVLPLSFLDRLNRFLERTPLRYFCLFMLVVARKSAGPA